MNLNNSNRKDLTGYLVSAILQGIESGSLPVGGKAKRVIWEEYISENLKSYIEYSEPAAPDVKDLEAIKVR
jgi:hypothetical protein